MFTYFNAIVPYLFRPLRADARRAGPGDVGGERLGGAGGNVGARRRGLRLDEGRGARLRLRGRGVDRRRAGRLNLACVNPVQSCPYAHTSHPVVHALPVARAVVAC